METFEKYMETEQRVCLVMGMKGENSCESYKVKCSRLGENLDIKGWKIGNDRILDG